MTTEQRIEALEFRVDSLMRSLIQMQKNQTPLISKIDQATNKVDGAMPYTVTKTVYIEDTEVIFRDVPIGNTSIYMTDTKGEYVPCSFVRLNGDLIVSFEKRTSLATVCLSIS